MSVEIHPEIHPEILKSASNEAWLQRNLEGGTCTSNFWLSWFTVFHWVNYGFMVNSHVNIYLQYATYNWGPLWPPVAPTRLTDAVAGTPATIVISAAQSRPGAN
jgi:hypothetical protein